MSSCLYCEKKIKAKSKYCNSQCQADKRYELFTDRWLNGLEAGHTGKTKQISNHIRRWLHEERGTACSQCGWDKRHPIDGKVMTEVDHIDGDS